MWAVQLCYGATDEDLTNEKLNIRQDCGQTRQIETCKEHRGKGKREKQHCAKLKRFTVWLIRVFALPLGISRDVLFIEFLTYFLTDLINQ